MKITLGPIPFLWDKDRIISFYKEIADSRVSVVYLGEVVCSKRSTLGINTLRTIAQTLHDRGKEVVISTLGLITNKAELDFIESLKELPYPVEANNLGTMNILLENHPSPHPSTPGGEGVTKRLSDKDIVGGPHLAVYNASTAKFLHSTGLKRIVFMPELDRSTIETISLSIPSCEKEIIGFGNLPLAFSWRCYTARAVNISKANCAIICKNYPDGMPLETIDGMSLFNINGTQLISGTKACMIEQMDIIRELGIEYIRIIPQMEHTADIIDIFSKVTEGSLSPQDALETLKTYAPEGISNGWFYGKAGWEYVENNPAEAGAGHSPQSYLQNNPG
jgi:collagenase-like PrtC family protease